MKANVANHLIHDLSSRFPIKSDDAINADLIGVVIDDWSNNRFYTSVNEVKFLNEQSIPENYLM